VGLGLILNENAPGPMKERILAMVGLGLILNENAPLRQEAHAQALPP
jgi:hypothetical protein